MMTYLDPSNANPELEDLKIDKWYSGCVPLGLDDDKYWLSELQVYLRSNFGKYFDDSLDLRHCLFSLFRGFSNSLFLCHSLL